MGSHFGFPCIKHSVLGTFNYKIREGDVVNLIEAVHIYSFDFPNMVRVFLGKHQSVLLQSSRVFVFPPKSISPSRLCFVLKFDQFVMVAAGVKNFQFRKQ